MARIEDLVRHGYRVVEQHRSAIVRALEEKLLEAIESCRSDSPDAGLNRALKLLAVARSLELPANLWAAQNSLLKLGQLSPSLMCDRALLAALAEKLELDPGLLN